MEAQLNKNLKGPPTTNTGGLVMAANPVPIKSTTRKLLESLCHLADEALAYEAKAKICDNNASVTQATQSLTQYMLACNTWIHIRKILLAQKDSSADQDAIGKAIDKFNDRSCMQMIASSNERIQALIERITFLKAQVTGQLESLEKGNSTSCSGKTENKANDSQDAEANCTNVEPTVIENGITFRHVVGLEQQKQTLRESFIAPLRYPNLFPKMSRGILLYGAPGTGKTLLVKAAISQLNLDGCPDIQVRFYNKSAAELKGSYHGETEKNIRNLFQCAAKQASLCEREGTTRIVSIIFLDEIEAIAGSRAKDTSGLMQLSVTMLLQMMDGLGSSENVAVIGATNLPWELDSAVLRRFDQQIHVRIPSDAVQYQALILRNLVEFFDSYQMTEGDKQVLADAIWKQFATQDITSGQTDLLNRVDIRPIVKKYKLLPASHYGIFPFDVLKSNKELASQVVDKLANLRAARGKSSTARSQKDYNDAIDYEILIQDQLMELINNPPKQDANAEPETISQQVRRDGIIQSRKTCFELVAKKFKVPAAMDNFDFTSDDNASATAGRRKTGSSSCAQPSDCKKLLSADPTDAQRYEILEKQFQGALIPKEDFIGMGIKLSEAKKLEKFYSNNDVAKIVKAALGKAAQTALSKGKWNPLLVPVTIPGLTDPIFLRRLISAESFNEETTKIFKTKINPIYYDNDEKLPECFLKYDNRVYDSLDFPQMPQTNPEIEVLPLSSDQQNAPKLTTLEIQGMQLYGKYVATTTNPTTGTYYVIAVSDRACVVSPNGGTGAHVAFAWILEKAVAGSSIPLDPEKAKYIGVSQGDKVSWRIHTENQSAGLPDELVEAIGKSADEKGGWGWGGLNWLSRFGKKDDASGKKKQVTLVSLLKQLLYLPDYNATDPKMILPVDGAYYYSSATATVWDDLFLRLLQLAVTRWADQQILLTNKVEDDEEPAANVALPEKKTKLDVIREETQKLLNLDLKKNPSLINKTDDKDRTRFGALQTIQLRSVYGDTLPANAPPGHVPPTFCITECRVHQGDDLSLVGTEVVAEPACLARILDPDWQRHMVNYAISAETIMRVAEQYKTNIRKEELKRLDDYVNQ